MRYACSHLPDWHIWQNKIWPNNSPISLRSKLPTVISSPLVSKVLSMTWASLTVATPALAQRFHRQVHLTASELSMAGLLSVHSKLHLPSQPLTETTQKFGQHAILLYLFSSFVSTWIKKCYIWKKNALC